MTKKWIPYGRSPHHYLPQTWMKLHQDVVTDQATIAEFQALTKAFQDWYPYHKSSDRREEDQ